jgi:hypothetical protein
VGAGIDLPAHHGQERLGRSRRAVVGQALVPGLAGQRVRRLERRRQRRLGRLVAGAQVLDPPLQAARPAGLPAAALGAEQPAPQLGRLPAAEQGRERAVGGLEQVVAFVEDVAARQPPDVAGSVAAAERRLHHDQGVVGDDEVGAPGATHRRSI